MTNDRLEGTTHSESCWKFGPGHYLCAAEKIVSLQAEIERLRALCACAYQMAGAYDAPVRFLDALSFHDEYAQMTPDQIMDALLPVASGHEPSANVVPCAGYLQFAGQVFRCNQPMNHQGACTFGERTNCEAP